MFRVARILRAVSPYTIFLMDQKKNPKLQGVTIAQRGRLLSKLYKGLSKAEMKSLQNRAAAQPSLNKKKPVRRRRAKTGFAVFVRDNYFRVKGLNSQRRLKALSQLYALQQPLSTDLKTLMKESAALDKKVKAAGRSIKRTAATKKAHA